MRERRSHLRRLISPWTTIPSSQHSATSPGQNEWLVEEMFAQYQREPDSVSESWRDFFADYRPMSGMAGGRGQLTVPAHPTPPTTANGNGANRSAASTNGATVAPRHAHVAPAAAPGDELGDPIRGAGARIVANMEASLDVPTATSFREVPARLLEVNRKVINGYLGRTRGGKVSFTHLIGYAVVRAVADAMPAMNSSFRQLGQTARRGSSATTR